MRIDLSSSPSSGHSRRPFAIPAPQFVIRTKACPGLRSGIDSRPSIRHSYENMSRTPIRDAPSNQPGCRLSTGETCRIGDRWSMAEWENVARRACPPPGSGWGVAESAAPIRCTKPQLRLFITWCAGASDSGESMPRTPIRGRNPGVGRGKM